MQDFMDMLLKFECVKPHYYWVSSSKQHRLESNRGFLPGRTESFAEVSVSSRTKPTVTFCGLKPSASSKSAVPIKSWSMPEVRRLAIIHFFITKQAHERELNIAVLLHLLHCTPLILSLVKVGDFSVFWRDD